MKERPSVWGPLFVYLICTKIDLSTVKEWESKASKDEIPGAKELIAFLEKRFLILEAVQSAKVINSSKIIFENKNTMVKREASHSMALIMAAIKRYACSGSLSICI